MTVFTHLLEAAAQRNNMQQPMENPAMHAEALSRMGRGPDTQLMHVTDSEVNALNGLSGLVFNEPLRTNPETGLPEAGLFKQLLPTILAIGAATFLGPGAASMFAGMGAGTAAGGVGALATGLGTGLAAFGGHALGRAATGQDFSLLKSGLAGLGAGATAGLTFDAGAAALPPDVTAGATSTQIVEPVVFSASPEAVANAGVDSGLSAMADVSPGFADAAGGFTPSSEMFSFPSQQAMTDFNIANSASSVAPNLGATEVATGFGGMRTGPEAYDYLAAEPMKRVVMPLGTAALSGDFDQPLPEAPSGPSRTPFTPKDFTFTRSRRDIDLDGDGEVSQEDIAQLVQGLPEGQSSRFYTPGAFTQGAKAGGLLRLQTGGNIQEAIGSLTGGAGASLLPMIAQSVIKPEDEEEESVSKGYPVGVAGTPPGAATTGMAIGGGQPPQPFQTGGALDAAMADVNADTAEANAEAAQANANAAQAAISIAGTIAGVPGLGIATNALGQLGSYYGQPEQGRHTLEFNPKSLIPFNPFGVPTIGDQVASQAATAQTNAVNSITNAMVQEDEPESFATEKDWATNKVTNKSEKEHRADIAEAEAETEAQDDFNTAMNAMAMAMSQETEEDNPESVAEAMGNTSSSGFGGFAGFSGIGGNVGQDDTTGDPDTSGNDAPGGGGGTGGNDGGFGSASGPGSGHGDAGFGGPGDADGPGGGAGAGGGAGSGAGDDGGDDGGPFQQGGYLGGISRRAHGGLLQLAEGGSVPYFEGMVRGSGDGMSDNIPFVIAGRQEGGQMGMQPAVLSPDEYVFPADVVSSLGNGSSNAGANQLDQFINNFRMDKYGRPNQPPEMRGGLSSLG